MARKAGTMVATIHTERAELKRIGAKVHKNSGRGQFVKADGNTELFIIDVKESIKTFGISVEVWSKICTDAIKTDKTKSPMLYLVLGEEPRRVRLAVIEYEILEELMERANGKENDDGVRE